MKFFQTLCLAAGLWGCGDAVDDARMAYYRQYLGNNAGALAVKDLAGEPAQLKAELNGKPVVLNLWATWCPPCLEEMPSLNELASQGDFNVIAISVDAKAERVAKYMEQYPQHFENIKVLHDANGKKQRPLLGGNQYPVTDLLNKRGIVQRIYTGPRAWHEADMVNKMKHALKN